MTAAKKAVRLVAAMALKDVSDGYNLGQVRTTQMPPRPPPPSWIPTFIKNLGGQRTLRRPSRKPETRCKLRLFRLGVSESFADCSFRFFSLRSYRLTQVAKSYGMNKGELQSLRQSTATFAGMVASFLKVSRRRPPQYVSLDVASDPCHPRHYLYLPGRELGFKSQGRRETGENGFVVKTIADDRLPQG